MRFCCVFAGKLFIVISVMLSRLVSEFIWLCAKIADVYSTDLVLLMYAIANISTGAGVVL